MKILAYILVIFLLSNCNEQKSNPKPELENANTIKLSQFSNSDSNKVYNIRDSLFNSYQFIDSTNLWSDNQYILAIKSNYSAHKVFIHIYQRSGSQINLVQTFDSLDSEFGDTEPVFENFNSDELMDFKIHYATGARGSNQFDYLFIQDPKSHLLKKIINTDHKPNLTFDTARNCITSSAYWAGVSFVDYKLISDSLLPTEGVDVYFEPPNWTIREHFIYDINGKQQLIKTDSIPDDIDGLYSRD